MTGHDDIYHRLFGDPRMVAQLLREFAAGPWLDGLDLDRIERLNTKFHAASGELREADVIWRIPHRTGVDTYLLLLLEFQSRSDLWMALRVLVYVGLLWQHLVAEKQLLPSGKLPPVLPIVLYNGQRAWSAPRALRDLIGLHEASPLWQWQPTMRYYVIDEGGFDEADLAQRQGLVPLLFRLENAADTARVVVLIDELIAAIKADPGLSAFRSVFVDLLSAVTKPLEPAIQLPNELLEIRSMLAERVESWKQQWLQEGRQEGRQEGEAALLLRQLERRFGPLPAWASDRIAAANIATLEEWGLRVLDGATLDEVLA